MNNLTAEEQKWIYEMAQFHLRFSNEARKQEQYKNRFKREDELARSIIQKYENLPRH